MKNELASDFGTLTDDHAVVFERRLPGSLALVWCYLTTRELLATWLGEGCFECKIGGNVRLYTSECSIQGVVTACRPYSRLGYSWDVRPNAGHCDNIIGWDSYVIFELRARGDHVILKLTHTPITDECCPRAFALWHTFLDRLLASMNQLRPEPLSSRVKRVLPQYQQWLVRRGAERSGQRRVSLRGSAHAQILHSLG
jgi:uncharacterized protein YndB with AHSA1/START domain